MKVVIRVYLFVFYLFMWHYTKALWNEYPMYSAVQIQYLTNPFLHPQVWIFDTRKQNRTISQLYLL